MSKDYIRRNIRARKTLLDDTEKRQAAMKVFHQLEQLAAFALSNNILIYHSLSDELSTLDFIDKWQRNKSFFLPRVNGVDLDILPYNRTRLQMGAFRIEEPQGDDITDPGVMEMVIVPAVAYDRNGNRIGRGRGYYDRLLPKTKALKVGVAYDFQIVDDNLFEPDAHDVAVDIVITESNIYYRKKR